jgi:hypothetical protein
MIEFASREPPEKHATSDDSSSFLMLSEMRNGFDDHPVAPEKLDKIGAAERRRILILPAARQPEVEPLDLKGEMSDLVFPEPHAEISAECLDQRDHQGRGGTQTRAGRRIDRGGDGRGNGLSTVVIPHHPLIDAAMQQKSGSRQFGRCGEHLLTSQILGAENDPVVLARAHEGVGEPIDRRVEHGATEFVAIGRKVGATTGETKPQRRARPGHGAKVERQGCGSVLDGN